MSGSTIKGRVSSVRTGVYTRVAVVTLTEPFEGAKQAVFSEDTPGHDKMKFQEGEKVKGWPGNFVSEGEDTVYLEKVSPRMF